MQRRTRSTYLLPVTMGPGAAGGDDGHTVTVAVSAATSSAHLGVSGRKWG